MGILKSKSPHSRRANDDATIQISRLRIGILKRSGLPLRPHRPPSLISPLPHPTKGLRKNNLVELALRFAKLFLTEP